MMIKIWILERILEASKQAEKSDLKEYKNSRGISLLSVVGTMPGRIIVDRIRKGVDRRLIK